MAVVSEQKVRLSVGKTLVNSVVSNVKAAGDTGILKDIDTDLQAIKTDVEVTLPVTIENKANAAAAAVNAHTDSKSNTITSAISSDGADTRTKVGNEANLIKVGQSNINSNISSSKQQILNKLDDLDIDLSPVETKVDAVKSDTAYIKQKIDQGGGGGGSDPRVLASLGEDEEDVTVHEKLDMLGGQVEEALGTQEAYVTNATLANKIDNNVATKTQATGIKTVVDANATKLVSFAQELDKIDGKIGNIQTALTTINTTLATI